MNTKPNLKDVCNAALELPKAERAAYLDVACNGDPALRTEVESLLAHEDTARDFLAAPAWQRVVAQMETEPPADLTDTQLGRYEMRTHIGAGGMGEVWKAWDKQLRREVAIKILPAEFAADPEHIARFQQEAQAASALKHQNIITIHEVGQATTPHGKLSFIVTELVAGQTLRELLAQSALSWRDAVLFATQIASALAAAHSADLIHRDIKPENIMVQANGQVKVLDFGIAKLGDGAKERGREGETARRRDAEIGQEISPSLPRAVPLSLSSSLTAPGARLGTIRYMSPEQARGEALDARTDIFSCGLVLYELLTGQRPYGQSEGEEMLRRLMDAEEIAPVSQQVPNIPAALDRIVTRALRKNREERYATASEMLNDLKELRVNQAEKGLQRLRTQSANQMLTQFAVRYDEDPTTRIPLGGLWTIGRFADLPRGRLERAVLRQSRWSVFRRLGGLALVIAAVTLGLAALASVTETWDEQVLRDGHTAAVRRAVFSPDGAKLVSVGEDKQVIVWDFAKRERLATFTDHTEWVAAVAFSPDGKWFATASYDKTVIVWDAIKLKKEAVLRGHRDKVVSIAFSPDGQVLASAASQPEPVDATLLWRVGSWERFAQTPFYVGEANTLLFANRGQHLIYHTDAGLPFSNTWDVATGQAIEDQFNLVWESNNAVISPDGALLIGVQGHGDVIFVDFKRRRLLDRFAAHQDNGRAVALSPDGRLAATGSENIILWDVATRRKITTIDYPSIVWSAAFSPDGRWLVSTHGDGGIRVWDVQERQRAIGFNEHNGPVRAVAWSRDGQRFASAGEDRSVMVWNAASGRREMLLTGHPTRVVGVAFAPDNHTLAAIDRDGLVIVWDIAERRERLQFKHPSGKQDVGANCLTYSPDGRVIATSHGAYDTTTGQQLADWGNKSEWLSASSIYGLVFSADGTRLATANAYGRSVVLDTATWRIREKVDLGPRQFISVSFAPDGQQLVTGEDGKLVQLWTASPLRPTNVLGQHTARIKSVAFSPDGTEVVSAGDDKTIALWNVSRRQLVTRIGLHTSPVYAVAWSPDGRQIISGAHDHSVRLYKRRSSLWGWRWE
ncbi:MAG: serine/threonine protein kinase [Acidobacteria bacterium]|nr:serine/threonine protein kinase [Acidobacteriota bacterium]